MSFSSQIKEELSLTKTGADHCRAAETAAITTRMRRRCGNSIP